MSNNVIAIHKIIRVPTGSKQQVEVLPGQKFKTNDKAEYDDLIRAGAVKDAASAESAEPSDGKSAKAPKGQKTGKDSPTDPTKGQGTSSESDGLVG